MDYEPIPGSHHTQLSYRTMTREHQLIFTVWVTTLHLITGTGAVRVELQPQTIMKHVNESLELVCSVTECSSEAGFTWKTVADKVVGGSMEKNHTTSRKVYKHITIADEKTIICVVNCEGNNQVQTKIHVYSFPADPVISRKGDSMLGCTVHSVYPAERFTLEWFSGNTLLPSDDTTFNSGDGAQDVSSEYRLSEEDLGKNITCRVTLNLSGVPENRQVRSATVQYGPAFIKVSSNATVKIGESLELRCDTDEQSNVTWKKLGKNETRNKVFEIKNATWSDAGVYECEASTELASRRSKVGVTVEGPPNIPQLELSTAANPRAGHKITLTCRSDSIPPGRLTLSGGSLKVAVEKEGSTVSVDFPSIQLQDSGLYVCTAENQHGRTNSSISVTVQAPPRNSSVLVQPSSQVLEDQNVTVHCSTVSFPPARVTLTREADGFKVMGSPNGTFHLIHLKSEHKGTYVVNFTNELGYDLQRFELIVMAQQSVAPILTKTVVPAVSLTSLLTAAALLIRHLRKAKQGYKVGEALDM